MEKKRGAPAQATTVRCQQGEHNGRKGAPGARHEGDAGGSGLHGQQHAEGQQVGGQMGRTAGRPGPARAS